jgi:hypothetical protein
VKLTGKSVSNALRGKLNVSDSHSSIADHIQTKWSIYQLKANGGEFMEDLKKDCRMLKELLQVSSHVQYLNRITELTTYMSI